MADRIAHRGPDGDGVWCDVESEIALAHRRLAILDLSEAGHQPMASASGRYVVAFNGEIYNHLDLRTELDKTRNGANWRGRSDTETLLAGLDAWGLEPTVQKSVGMFAFAVWDRQTRTLTLGRDRMGEKPVYYGWHNGVFLFGSELKALKAHPAFEAEIDLGSVALQLRFNCIPAPYSIYRAISKLPPGMLLDIRLSGRSAADREKPRAYWRLADVVCVGKSDMFASDEVEATEHLEGLLRRSVAQQMIADVPLGAFLSGGIDSSLVVALMQAQSNRPVKTFTIGFNEAGYNEAEHAKAVAAHLATEHTELYATSQQAMDVIPKLASIYDEPFSDPSQIPTFLVSQLARQHVTVSLSGDAGDEIFGGYRRYFATQKYWPAISAAPSFLRRLGAGALMAPSPASWETFGGWLQKVAPRNDGWLTLGDKMQKLAGVLQAESSSALYSQFVSHWSEPDRVVIGGREPESAIQMSGMSLDDPVEQMMAMDAISYLPDDILVKVDRAAMAVSLETRVPMLDHRVVEFAWRLPLRMKVRQGEGKRVLRKILYKYVPQTLIERPKMGFGVPIDNWLRGPLRDWAEDLLEENRLRQAGIFDPEPIRRKWREHVAGQRNWQYLLWNILMFQAWLHVRA